MSLKDIFKEKAYEKKGNCLTAYNHFSTFSHMVPAKQIQKIMGYANIASARIFEDVVINRAV